jgi:hypothetical protein
MKQIAKYRSVDGREFSTEKECLDYETLIDTVNTIMARLKPLPREDGCDFRNGHSFVQQSKAAFKLVKLNLLNEVKKHINHKWIRQTMEDETVHLSYVGRLIDDCNIPPLNNAWSRLMCIDKEYREWGQPYFANNPEESPALQKKQKQNT